MKIRKGSSTPVKTIQLIRNNSVQPQRCKRRSVAARRNIDSTTLSLLITTTIFLFNVIINTSNTHVHAFSKKYSSVFKPSPYAFSSLYHQPSWDRNTKTTTLLTVILSPSSSTALSFSHHDFYRTVNNRQRSSPFSSRQRAQSTLYATRERTGVKKRTGVRNRVKSVLRKASNRTGLKIKSAIYNKELLPNSKATEIKKQTAYNVVAETASIGGLGAVIVDEETGEMDVALDFIDDSTNTNVKKKVKKAPASTSSPPIRPEKLPEENLTLKSSSLYTPTSALTSAAVLKSDVSAAFSLPSPPLPFTLPKLSSIQKALLQNGERVQFQSEMGREGSGFVVLDVKAPESTVWDCLLDFPSYPSTIPTVRDIRFYDSPQKNKDCQNVLTYGKSGMNRALFTLSRKFRLKIAVKHDYYVHPQGDYLIFQLDDESRNFVLKKAKGVWYTESKADGLAEGYTRVWLLAELRVSSLLPRMIVDYAAKKAFPRATSWIKPHVEAAASLWLKPNEEADEDEQESMTNKKINGEK